MEFIIQFRKFIQPKKKHSLIKKPVIYLTHSCGACEFWRRHESPHLFAGVCQLKIWLIQDERTKYTEISAQTQRFWRFWVSAKLNRFASIFFYLDHCGWNAMKCKLYMEENGAWIHSMQSIVWFSFHEMEHILQCIYHFSSKVVEWLLQQLFFRQKT